MGESGLCPESLRSRGYDAVGMPEPCSGKITTLKSLSGLFFVLMKFVSYRIGYKILLRSVTKKMALNKATLAKSYRLHYFLILIGIGIIYI